MSKFKKNPNIKYSMEYYKAEALRRIQELYPDAVEGDITDRYEIAYWNDYESFIDKMATIEYPGETFPGPIQVSEEEMIEILVRTYIDSREEEYATNS